MMTQDPRGESVRSLIAAGKSLQPGQYETAMNIYNSLASCPMRGPGGECIASGLSGPSGPMTTQEYARYKQQGIDPRAVDKYYRGKKQALQLEREAVRRPEAMLAMKSRNQDLEILRRAAFGR